MAKENGLEPLAEMILAQEKTTGTLQRYARPFLSEQVPTVQDAYQGARDIVAEIISENANVRTLIRAQTLQKGVLSCSKAKGDTDPQGKFQMYYDFSERLATLPPHRLLAINRGEHEKALKVRLEAPVEALISLLEGHYLTNPRSVFVEQARQAVHDAYKRLIAPAIAREVRNARTKEADEEAIQVFASNLRSLLLQPPMRGQVVMGIDPGYRSGCKVTVADPTSRYLEGTTIYPHAQHRQWEQSKATLGHLIAEHGVRVVAIGNGTASRETESLVAETIAMLPAERSTQYVIVDEAGASVYSASELARKELPGLDVAMRGAVSIARRLQDPLAELVKISPRSIGVGLYQHDVDQKRLGETLDAVVESTVNFVGVDLNTASASLLSYVAGINKRLAANIVAYRDDVGPFLSRRALKKVKGVGDKAFEQAAGFLRIPDGDNALDNTAIHPESYAAVGRLFTRMEVRGDEPDLRRRLAPLSSRKVLAQVAATLHVGLPTLQDIIEALLRPGRDPRDELPPPVLRQDVLKMEDLTEGMILQGTVRNVVPFGAFVDIGVKQDGLVHISEMADHYVRDPLQVVAVGNVVRVRVMNVDLQRGRIGLSMKGL